MASSNLATKIQDLIGKVDQNNLTAVSEWLTQSARDVINALPKDMLWTVATDISDSGGGSGASLTASVTNGVITAVNIVSGGSGYSSDPEVTVSHASGINADIRAFQSGGVVTAVDIINGGTGYTTSNLTLSVSGGGGASVTTAKILHVHKSGVKAREVNPADKTLISNTSSIFKPSSNDPKYYRENGKIHVLPDGGTVVAVNYPNVVYTSQTISGVPKDIEYIIVLGAAVKGRMFQLDVLRRTVDTLTLPSLDVSKLQVLLAPSPVITDISISATAPSFTAPPSPNIATLDLSSYDAELNNIHNKTNEEITIQNYEMDALPSPPIYDTQSIDVGSTTINTAFSSMKTALDDDDIEKGQGYIQQVTAHVNQMQTNIANATNEFNDANTEYQAKIQKLIADAQAKQSEDASILALARDEVAVIQQKINNDIQEYQNNEIQNKFQEWATSYSNGISKYNSDISLYNANISKEIQQYQLNEVQKEMALYIQKENDKIQKANLESQSELSRFNNELSKYQAETGTTFQKYSGMFQELGVLQNQYQQALATLIQPYISPRGAESGK